MRLLPCTMCVLAALAVSVPGTSQDRRAPGSGIKLPVDFVEGRRIERLEQWIKAVARHVPGEEDATLVEISGWPNASLKQLYLDANALWQTMRRIGGDGGATLTVRPADQQTAVQVRYSKEQFHRLQALACAAGGLLFENGCVQIRAGDELDPDLRQVAVLARASNMRGDRNYLIRRAAILHSDVAMLAPASMVAPGSVGRPAAGAVERIRMEISDGQELNLHQSAIHWEIARMLLDLVVPTGADRAQPSGDEMVRLWYRATATWMQLREDHDKLHLDRARQLFPADPDLLLLAGFQRETFAGVPVQTAVQSALLPSGVTMDVESARLELRAAETLFVRALELRPDHAEGRLHHGRVLALLGRHADALVELRRASAAAMEPQLAYYAQLFLGGEEEQAGNRDAARAAYEQAAVLAPMAQSPLLALSQLARRSGDRPGALRAIDQLFALAAADRGERDDPWWWYYVSQGRDADALLDAVQAPFRSERLQ